MVSIVDICVGDGVGTRLHVSSYTIVVIVIVISEKRENENEEGVSVVTWFNYNGSTN